MLVEAYCQWLRAFTASNRIPTLDFSAAIDWADDDLYLAVIHQSPAGHQRMADRLIAFLLKTVGSLT